MSTEPDSQSLMSAEVQACPYGYYRQLREHAPLYRMPDTGFWLVTSFELAREIIRQPDLFASGVSPMALRPGGVPPAVIDVFANEGWLPKASCSTSDPPSHTRVRSFLEPLFTAKRVRDITPLIERTVGELMKGWPDRHEVEFIAAFAHPLPMIVIAELIGVPSDNLARFKAWSDAIVEPFSMMVSEEREVECARLVVEMQHYFKELLEQRARHPADDLLTAVAASASPDQQGFDLAEQLTILTIDLLASGNETTTAAIASGLKLLAEDPATLAALRAEPARLETFCEEVLRLESPAQGMFRRVTRDTVLGGQALREGELISLRFGAANRDPEQFPDPDRIDLDRRPAGKHLAFGIGRHHCIGAQLARQELLSSFGRLVGRYRRISMAPGRPAPEYQPSFFGRNLRELYLFLEA
ncbi:MAG: cytochrome P450 [Steroidobacteraceae bacterium]